MTKFSNSSFSSFPAALVWRLPVVYSHFKRAVGLWTTIQSSVWHRYSAMNTRYAVSCWVFSGFPEIGVMLSASLLLTLQTAAATDLMQCLRRLGATNRRCSVFCCALSRRKTTHKIICNRRWLSDLELHTGRCCSGQLSDNSKHTNDGK